MSPTPPANVSYGLVTWRIIKTKADSADADRYPDAEVLQNAKVTFTPEVSHGYVLDAGALVGPVTIAIDPVTCGFDTDGYLVDGQGSRGVYLVATDDSDLNPTGWTYRVQLTATGSTYLPFSIAVPKDVTTDLTTVVPVSTSTGTYYLVGPAGPPGADGLNVVPGGTTGQVLTKESGADGDYDWADPTGGLDTEAVQDLIAATVLGGTGVFASYDDTAGTLTLEAAIDSLGITDSTSIGRALITTPDGATAIAAIGAAAASHVHSGADITSGTINNSRLSAGLAAVGGLTPATDRLPYFTGVTTAALATFTAAGRALVDDADAAAQRATLGLVIGTDVQAFSSTLTTWAGKTPPSGTVLGTSDAQEATATRLKPRVSGYTSGSSATITPSLATQDFYFIGPQTGTITFGNPSGGSPTHGEEFAIRLTDGGTAVSIVWNAIYRASAFDQLPATTVPGQPMYFRFKYNVTDTKWDLLYWTPGRGAMTVAASLGTFTTDSTTTALGLVSPTSAFTIANPSGSPFNGQRIVWRVKDDGTARAISYGSQFRAMGVLLPTSTVVSKYLTLFGMYNSTDTKWDVFAAAQEA